VSVLMQETLWCSVTPCGTTQLFTVAPSQGRLVASDLFNDSLGTGQMWVSPDGALQVWLTQTLQGQVPAYSLLVRAVTDGSVLRIPVASAAPSLVGSPVGLEVYLSDFASPYALSPGGVRRFAADQCSGSPQPRAVSADGSRLAVACFTIQFVGELPVWVVGETLIYDVATGAIVRRLEGGGPNPVLSADGRVLFASVPSALPRTLMRADVDSGTTSNVVLAGLPAEPRAFLNPLAAELFVVDGDALTVFDPDTL
jgi:hypothetical protein